MKKNLLFIYAAFTSMLALAQSQAPVAQWGEILDSSTAGDQASAIVVGKNHQVYWLATAGSTETAPEVRLGSDVLFLGEPYNSGNSFANNLCLVSTDFQGQKQWVIYSNSGDFASGQGAVAVDAQGNVVFSAKLRNGDDLSKPITIVDATGNITSVGNGVEKRSYNLLVAKASADGKLLWHKYITLSTQPGEAATTDFVADAVKSSALAVDPDGNIYVGGNFAADMTVSDDVVLQPANVANWNGNSQTSAGDMFILKFDSNGNYLASAIGSEGVQQSQLTNLEWANGSLYMLGNAQGDAEMSFAGKTVKPSEFQSQIVGKLSADLNAQWLKCLPGADIDGTCVLQNTGITVVDNTLWIAGQFNGKITDGNGNSVASVAKNPREGLIIKLDALNGNWLAATTSRAADFTPEAAKTTLQGYFKILQNPQKPELCYAYGYVMNATVGIVLREYNAETLVANVDNAWSLVTQGGVPSCTAIAYDAETNCAFITGRGNKAFSLLADPAIETAAPSNWGVIMAAFDMPEALKQSSSPAFEGWDGVIPAVNADATFSGGDGSIGNPYQIATAQDLAQLAANVNGQIVYKDTYFIQTADIALNNQLSANTWPGIGNNANPSFQGNYNGQFFAIEGMLITERTNYAGLFGFTRDAVIENVYVTGASVNVDVDNLMFCFGIIAGDAQGTVFKNCHTDGDIHVNISANKSAYVGGIVGMGTKSSVSGNGNTIINCFSTANINSTVSDGVTPLMFYAAGISAQVNGLVQNCYYGGKMTYNYVPAAKIYSATIAGNPNGEPVVEGNFFSLADGSSSDIKVVGTDVADYSLEEIASLLNEGVETLAQNYDGLADWTLDNTELAFGDKHQSAIINIEFTQDMPVEYYNLQGMRVNSNSLTPGLYIRRQGNSATKILIK